MVSFTLGLKCEECGAKIEVRDQKPEWKTDEALVQQYEAAEQFVEANWGKSVRGISLPPFVVVTPAFHKQGGFDWYGTLAPKPEAKYIDCPCCGGKVRYGSGKAE